MEEIKNIQYQKIKGKIIKKSKNTQKMTKNRKSEYVMRKSMGENGGVAKRKKKNTKK